QYLSSPEASWHAASAEALLTGALAQSGKLEEARAAYDQLHKAYPRDSGSNLIYADESNLRYAGAALFRGLVSAKDWAKVEEISRSRLSEAIAAHKQAVFDVGSEAGALDRALWNQGKKDDISKVDKQLASAIADAKKIPDAAKMWFTIRQVEAMEQQDPQGALRLLEKAKPEFEAMSFGRIYETDRARLSLYDAPAPSLSAAVWLNSKPLSLPALRGKVVLLDFWMSWCMPCRAGFPALIDLWHKYRQDGLVVIGVTENDGWVLTKDRKAIGRGKGDKLTWGQEVPLIRQFVKDFGLTMPIAIGRRPHDPKNPYAASPIWARYGIDAFPRGIVIDRKGVIRFVGFPDDAGYLPAIKAALFGGGSAKKQLSSPSTGGR
ncbi:MAG TPA: redoxin domain-containing protein, partial [Thermoanaerobaculia bacterium]|nr:redoxin domain-containing protein [Thermoanaerobaculia bacterium]